MQAIKNRVKCKIKKGDTVIVIAGKDKGKQGSVKQVALKHGITKVLVEGVNMMKKHIKPNPQRNIEGGIVSKEAFLDISNVQILNPATGKADRIGYKFLDDGQKARYFKSTNELVDAK